MLELYQYIRLEEERQRPYYVDNDFFENKYALVGDLKYFCIKEREITDWNIYSEKNAKKENERKILYFSNYKK